VIWLSWRRQRTETLIAGGLVAVLAAWLVPAGLHMASVFHDQGLSACTTKRSGACGALVAAFNMRFDNRGVLDAAFYFVPGLIGVLLAAPILLELERGTYRLTWTQGVPRRRFITWRLGFALLSGVAAALVLTALLSWRRHPLDQLNGRMGPGTFDLEGTVAIGYILLATGLALAVGAVWRKAVPAIVVGFVGYSALRIFVTDWLRQRFISPIAVTWHGSRHGAFPVPRTAWLISEYPSDAHGHRIEPIRSCLRPCLLPEKPKVEWIHSVYEPASRFWTFQGIETALFLGLALAFVGFAAWWMRSRVA
jgi:hypothetical protein